MLSTIAALAIAPVAYSLPAGTTDDYYVRIGLDGFLPLLGGKQGKAEVDMTVGVQGLSSAGADKASSDIKDFHIFFNGQEFPIDLESVKQYFPKNTVTFTPQGHVLTNDAPDMKLPVRLPGLDPKRFPDITYLPIEFPAAGVTEGQSWTFKKPFEGVDLNYTVTPTHVDDKEIDMKIDLSQHDSSYEDDAHGMVDSAAGAEAKVDTDLKGAGTAVFDRQKNLVTSISVQMNSDSTVTDLHTKQVEHRQLTTTLNVSQGKPLSPSALVLGGPPKGLLNLLGGKVEQSGTVQRALVGAQFVHPGDGLRRAAEPLLSAAVEQIYVPGKLAAVRQAHQLSVLAGQAVSRVPELVNVQRVQQVGGFLSGVPGVVRSHWRPYNERLEGFVGQLVDYFSPN